MEDYNWRARYVAWAHDKYDTRIGEKGKSKTYREYRHDDDGIDDEEILPIEMVMLLMRELMLTLGADDRPTWGSLSSLSEPHDQPYPTQPYATKPSQFPNFTNCDTLPYKFPTVGAGTAPWEGECHISATVQWCDRTMYDVQ